MKVFLGMSGGVDSSVSAALLKTAGHDVTGVFIKSWEPAGVPCNWREERRDAMRVAAELGIPLRTLDLSAEYERAVVAYLVAEYRAGRTPNPDVMCNKAIKFGAFYDWARTHGADFVATGHYAQTNGRELLRAKDEAKDQTYFLWTLTPEILAHTLFPIGHLLKSEVRDLAKKFNLPVAEKKDSQGVCFVGPLDLKDFLKTQIKTEVGEVRNERGEKVGEHDGAILYTIGERHGFTIHQTSPQQKPYYVVGRDLTKNILIVSDAPEKVWREHKEVKLREVNWISEPTKISSKGLFARIRHRGELVPCRILAKNIEHRMLDIYFDEPPAALAAGQSLVLYDGDVCVGGGIIS